MVPMVMARQPSNRDPGACPGGGESRAEIRARVREAVTDLTRDHPGERVALVTHLGVIRALGLVSGPGGLPPISFLLFSMAAIVVGVGLIVIDGLIAGRAKTA